MATTKKATLIGATGLIGGHLLKCLEQDDAYDSIKLLVRRPFEVVSSKTHVNAIDFGDGAAFRKGLQGSDIIFCAIGSTQQKAGGDKAAYRKIDFDIAVDAARYGQESGCRHFVLVSSVGANAKAGNFYLKLKGEIEEAVQAVGLPAVSIFQPSMLLGNRQEKRTTERIGQAVMSNFSFLIASKYKPIVAADVAKAMTVVGREETTGITIYTYREMKALLQKNL